MAKDGMGLLHSEDDKPAVVRGSVQEWWSHGHRHRDRDRPAVVSRPFDGRMWQQWWQHGKLHRGFDRPAEIDTTRTPAVKKWYKHGELHRDGDRPVVVFANGEKEWRKGGVLHRGRNKPAAIRADGTRVWYLHGIEARNDGGPVRMHADGALVWTSRDDPKLPNHMRTTGVWEWWYNHGSIVKQITKFGEGGLRFQFLKTCIL